MDRKVCAVGIVIFFAVTAVTASMPTCKTPLFAYRMEQQSSKMCFLPTAVNGFTYTTEDGYTLDIDSTGAVCVRPEGTLWDSCDGTCDDTCWETCWYSCEGSTCAQTCPYTCWSTCPNTCQNTCPSTCQNTCPYTCWNTCEETCGGTCFGATCWDTCSGPEC